MNTKTMISRVESDTQKKAMNDKKPYVIPSIETVEMEAVNAILDTIFSGTGTTDPYKYGNDIE